MSHFPPCSVKMHRKSKCHNLQTEASFTLCAEICIFFYASFYKAQRKQLFSMCPVFMPQIWCYVSFFLCRNLQHVCSLLHRKKPHRAPNLWCEQGRRKQWTSLCSWRKIMFNKSAQKKICCEQAQNGYTRALAETCITKTVCTWKLM